MAGEHQLGATAAGGSLLWRQGGAPSTHRDKARSPRAIRISVNGGQLHGRAQHGPGTTKLGDVGPGASLGLKGPP